MLSSLRLTSRSPVGKQQIKKLKTIWQSLQDSNDSTQFRMPVDWRGMGLTDYPSIVKYPMDLSTVNRKLRQSKYQTVQECLDDIQLIWDNCKLYNQQGCWIYDLADKLQKSFKRMVKTFLPTVDLPQQPGAQNKQTQQPSAVKAEEQQIKYHDKIRFTQRIKLLKPDELGLLVKKIIEICPLAFREGQGDKAQIIVDNMDIISFKKVIETLDQLQDLEDNVQKRMKM